MVEGEEAAANDLRCFLDNLGSDVVDEDGGCCEDNADDDEGVGCVGGCVGGCVVGIGCLLH